MVCGPKKFARCRIKFGRSVMNVEDFEKEFLALSGQEQMKVLRKIMPAFCRNMAQDPGKVLAISSLLTEECGEPMANMISVMAMMRKGKGGGCCG